MKKLAKSDGKKNKSAYTHDLAESMRGEVRVFGWMDG
jgi:hypothetical protein